MTPEELIEKSKKSAEQLKSVNHHRQSTESVVADTAATLQPSEATQRGTSESVVTYLEQKLAAANQRVMELENVLLLYREYAVGLEKLTKSVFAEGAEGEGNADRTG